MSTNYKTLLTLDQIYISNDCGCKKPEKKSCGCKKEEKNACNCKDFFTVENLFSELRSEWLKDAARLNLGITDIYNIEMIPSTENGGINELIITYRKGYNEWKKSYQIRNGLMGKISSASVSFIEPGQNPHIAIDETENGQNLIFYLPKAEKGDKGDSFRYEDFTPAQLAGLKGDPGKDGKDGNKGDKGDKGDTGVGISEITYSLDQNITGYEGKGTKVFVTLTNGNTYDFFVPNGKNGQGGGEGDSSYPNIPMYVYAYRRNNSSTPPAINTFSSGDNWPMGWTRHQSGVNESYLYEWAVVAENVTYENDHFVYSNWSDPFIVARYGKDGNDGNDGADGTNGSSGNLGQEGAQGLTGPVIRFRGEYSTSHDVLYVNEENYTHYVNEEVDPTYIRYIDIVFYKDLTDETDNGNYYKVKSTTLGNGRRLVTGHSTPSTQPKQNTTDWEPAVYFDFAYIETLISKYISTITLDAREIRIIGNSGHLVAGMTSGNPATSQKGTETNNTNLQEDPIRIWAGTTTNTNIDYTLNLNDAAFKVRQSGKLEASNADIEGAIKVNDLILKNSINSENSSYYENEENIQLGIIPKDDSGTVEHKIIYVFTDDNTITLLSLTQDAIESDTNFVYKSTSTNPSSVVLAKDPITLDSNSVYSIIGTSLGWRIVKLDIPTNYEDIEYIYKTETLELRDGHKINIIYNSIINDFGTFYNGERWTKYKIECLSNAFNWPALNYTESQSTIIQIDNYKYKVYSAANEFLGGGLFLLQCNNNWNVNNANLLVGYLTLPGEYDTSSLKFTLVNSLTDLEITEKRTLTDFLGTIKNYLVITLSRVYLIPVSPSLSTVLPNCTIINDEGMVIGYIDDYLSPTTVTNLTKNKFRININATDFDIPRYTNNGSLTSYEVQEMEQNNP